MPVEIRELVIKTNISSKSQTEAELEPQNMALLRQKIMQACLKAVKEKAVKSRFER